MTTKRKDRHPEKEYGRRDVFGWNSTGRVKRKDSETLNKCLKQFVVAVEFFHICLCR